MTGFICENCGKAFPMYATLEETKTMPGSVGGYAVVRKPCCPYCISIEIADNREFLTASVKVGKLSMEQLLSLPPRLQRTMIAIQELREATASEVAEVTERSRSVETIWLNQLARMGYLTKLRRSHKVYFILIESSKARASNSAKTPGS